MNFHQPHCPPPLAASADRRRLLGKVGGLAVGLMGSLAGGLTAPAAASEHDGDDRDRRSRDWFTDTELLDHDGGAHRFYSDLLAPAQPRVTLVHAVFTSCSSACPLIIQKLKAVRDQASQELRRELWILSLTVDPLNDLPSVLKAFAVRHDIDEPQWRLLTGQVAAVETVGRRLGLWALEPDAHQTTLIAGRARAGYWAKLRPDLPADDLARQLGRFLA